VTGISTEALEVLLNHNYPGNIRELRNIIEYVFIFCNEGQIQLKHLPEYLRAAGLKQRDTNESQNVAVSSLETFLGEKEQILDALSKARWNKKEAAEILQIDRTTLWRKIKKYGIK
jgi:transcriptional regulator of acetoin/glycerol metabolism